MVGVASIDPAAGVLTTRAVAGDPAGARPRSTRCSAGRSLGWKCRSPSCRPARSRSPARPSWRGHPRSRRFSSTRSPRDSGPGSTSGSTGAGRTSWASPAARASWATSPSGSRLGAELENRELVEAFVGQASVALLRRVARQRLLESEARYRAVVEGQHELVCRFRPDGTHLVANEAYCRFFGLDPATPSPDRASRPRVPRGRAGGPPRPLPRSSPRSAGRDDRAPGAYCPDGTTRWLQWSDRAFFDRNGAVEEFQSVGRDVTERKEAEEALAALTTELEDARRDGDGPTPGREPRPRGVLTSRLPRLRAPLRAIDGYLGILMARFGSDLDPRRCRPGRSGPARRRSPAPDDSSRGSSRSRASLTSR